MTADDVAALTGTVGRELRISRHVFEFGAFWLVDAVDFT